MKTAGLAILAITLAGCGGARGPQMVRAATTAATGDVPAYGQQPEESQYRAVLMSDGMVLFGKLHLLGTPYPVLTDVYYVQTATDPKTHKPTSVLVKRGQEWHAPDRTVLNASQIVLIEPVTNDSKVMQLIERAQQQP